MFRATISPIFRSTRLCVTVCGIMHPRCCRPAASWVLYTASCNRQSSAPEDGRNRRPKHVELIGIINKPLLLHLVDCLYYPPGYVYPDHQVCSHKRLRFLLAFGRRPFRIEAEALATLRVFVYFFIPIKTVPG